MSVSSFITENKGNIIAGAIGLGLGGALGYVAKRKRNKSSSKRKSPRKYKSRKVSRRYKQSRTRRISKRQKKPYTAGKKRDTSKRRIRYTKNNQPYVIMANGRARFISKKSVRMSRKRNGGRY